MRVYSEMEDVRAASVGLARHWGVQVQIVRATESFLRGSERTLANALYHDRLDPENTWSSHANTTISVFCLCLHFSPTHKALTKRSKALTQPRHPRSPCALAAGLAAIAVMQ